MPPPASSCSRLGATHPLRRNPTAGTTPRNMMAGRRLGATETGDRAVLVNDGPFAPTAIVPRGRDYLRRTPRRQPLGCLTARSELSSSTPLVGSSSPQSPLGRGSGDPGSATGYLGKQNRTGGLISCLGKAAGVPPRPVSSIERLKRSWPVLQPMLQLGRRRRNPGSSDGQPAISPVHATNLPAPATSRRPGASVQHQRLRKMRRRSRLHGKGGAATLTTRIRLCPPKTRVLPWGR